MKKRNYKLIFGSIIFLTLVLFIFIGPLIYKVNPNTTDVMKIEIKPNGKFLLGTDATGRDILARLMAGGKVSLTVGILATAVKIMVSLFPLKTEKLNFKLMIIPLASVLFAKLMWKSGDLSLFRHPIFCLP